MNKTAIRLATLGCLLLAALPDHARACTLDASAAACTPGYVGLPVPAPTAVPANLPAIALWPQEASNFMLRAGTEVVPTELQVLPGGGSLLVPAAPLAANTDYQLSYEERCVDPTMPLQATGAARSMSFRTGTTLPFPSSVGEVSVELESGDYGDECGEVLSAWAELTLRPSAELVPWLPYVTLTAALVFPSIDGVRRQVGALRASEDELEIGDLVAACDGSADIKPVMASVIIVADIPGATTQPTPINLEVDLRCPADAGVTTPGTVIGDPDAGAGSGSASGSNGTDDGEVAPMKKMSDGGCSLASKHGSFPVSLLLALAALRTRRRSGCRSRAGRSR